MSFMASNEEAHDRAVRLAGLEDKLRALREASIDMSHIVTSPHMKAYQRGYNSALTTVLELLEKGG